MADDVEGSDLFLVIFLIVFVCALSCGLLWFICTKLIEDAGADGACSRHLNFGAYRKQQMAEAHRLGAPKRIIVTRPPKEEEEQQPQDSKRTDEESGEQQANDGVQTGGTWNTGFRGGGGGGTKRKLVRQDTLELPEEAMFERPRSGSFRERLGSIASRLGWRGEEPEEKVIYSCETTPSPTSKQKEFFWSKSKNFDYFQNVTPDDISPTEKLNDIFLGKGLLDSKARVVPVQQVPGGVSGVTPLGMFHGHQTIIRCSSAPLRPKSAVSERVLHM